MNKFSQIKPNFGKKNRFGKVRYKVDAGQQHHNVAYQDHLVSDLIVLTKLMDHTYLNFDSIMER
jgi:hypothetical protein